MTTSVSKVPLKYLTTKIGSGKTPRGGAEVYVSSGVMLLRSQNVHFDGLRLDDVVYVEEAVDEEMASTRVFSGDVLLNITGASIGRCTVVPASLDAANVNQHVCIIRPDPARLDAGYLNVVLQSHEIQMTIRSSENGSSREGLNFEQVGLFEIPMRSLAEQRLLAEKASNEIDGLETLIAEKRRLLELLAEKRRALITHVVTHGLNPDVPRRDSGIPWLGEIPTHWKTSRVAWLFDERDERSQSDLPLLEVSIHGGVRLREFSEERIEQVAEDFNSYKVARSGDISFNKMRMWQGAIGKAPCDGLVSPDYVVAQPSKNLDSDYFGLLFRTSAFSAEAGSRSHGIVWDRLRLYWEEFRDISVPVPPLDEQERIVAYVQLETQKVDELIAASAVTVSLLHERRSALISAAITGRFALASCSEAALTA